MKSKATAAQASKLQSRGLLRLGEILGLCDYSSIVDHEPAIGELWPGFHHDRGPLVRVIGVDVVSCFRFGATFLAQS